MYKIKLMIFFISSFYFGCFDVCNASVIPLSKYADLPVELRSKTHRTEKDFYELFTALGLRYMKKQLFDLSLVSQLQPVETLPDYLECPRLYIKREDLGTHPLKPVAMNVRFVNDRIGFGVFAAEKIRRGRFIDYYTGDMVCDCTDGTYAWEIAANVQGCSKKFYIDAARSGNLLRFVNDNGENSNCTPRKVYYSNNIILMAYFASQDIEEGDQLFVPYGDQYWNPSMQRIEIQDFRIK